MVAEKAYIFASGPVTDYDYIKNRLPKGAYIICADGGAEHCVKCGFNPDIVIGDMDSLTVDLNNSVFKKYPREKDDTDTSLCIKYAIEMGYKNIEIFGAIGGRLDHSIANLQLLSFCRNNGINCILSDKQQTVFLVENETQDFETKIGDTVSVFSCSVKSENITFKGLKYPLEHADLNNSFPLGISNVALDTTVSVSVEKGTLLIIISH